MTYIHKMKQIVVAILVATVIIVLGLEFYEKKAYELQELQNLSLELPSCQQDQQQFQQLPPTPHELSQNDCLKKWQPYIDLHNRIMNGSADQRFIVYKRAIGGFGNRMLGLTSALLIGVLTNRALLLQDWIEIADFLKWPVNNMIYNKSEPRFIELKQKAQHFGWANTCFTDGNEVSTSLLTMDLEEKQPLPVSFFHTNCPLHVWIVQNTKYRSVLKSMGLFENEDFAAFEVLNSLLGFLFNLSPELKILAERHKKMYWEGKEVVGVHIRTGRGEYTQQGNLNGWTDYFAYLQGEEVAAFWKCATHLVKDLNNAVWFVATDSLSLLLEADKAYPQINYYNGTLMHMDISTYYTTPVSEDTKREGIIKIILDNYLLGEAKNIIITEGSTYGMIAASRAGLNPYYVGSHYSECRKAAKHRFKTLLSHHFW